MLKLEKGTKIVVRKKRRFILIIAVLLMLLCLIFYMGSKINSMKPTVNNTIKTTKNTLTIPATNTKMNSRESNVNDTELNIDSSAVNVYKSDGHKIAYLTFDDGPSANITPGVLKILDKYDIKATFFIVGKMAMRYPDLLKQEVADGQSIGNHTYSHDYKYIYSDTKAFISDVNKCEAVLKSIIGNNFSTRIVRFPGGSFGGKLQPFREALKSDGYHYIDWNDLTGDADGQNIPVDKLLDNLKKYTKGKEHVVILMHDASTKVTTVQALPQVVEYLKSQGYSFSTLK